MAELDDYLAPVKSFFYGNPKDAPPSPQSLESQRKTLAAILARRSLPPPTNIGQGINALGAGIADNMRRGQLDTAENAYNKMLNKDVKGAPPLPGTPTLPPVGTPARPPIPPAAVRPLAGRPSPLPPAATGPMTTDTAGDAQDTDRQDGGDGGAERAADASASSSPRDAVAAAYQQMAQGIQPPIPYSGLPGASPPIWPPPYFPDASGEQSAATPDSAQTAGPNMMAQPTGLQLRSPPPPDPNGPANWQSGKLQEVPTDMASVAPGTFGQPPSAEEAPSIRVADLNGGFQTAASAVNNPRIVAPDITPLPQMAQAAPRRSLGTVPDPNATLPAQPPAAQPGGRTPVQPVRVYSEPAVPRMNETPTQDELYGMNLMRAHPGDENYKSLAAPYIAYGQAKRKADYDQAVKQYDFLKSQFDEQQKAARTAPETEVSRQKAEIELEQLKQLQRSGGITPAQEYSLIEKSHEKAEPLTAATEQIRNAQRVLPSMITGFGADARVNVSRLMSLLTNTPVASGVAANQAFQNYIAGALGTLRPQVAGTGAQSNAELNILRQAAGADPSLEPGAIAAVLGALDKLNFIAAQQHQKKLATYAGDASAPEYEKRKSVAYNNFGLPMESILPDSAVAIFKQRHETMGDKAIEEVDRRYHTPGLGQAILDSGR